MATIAAPPLGEPFAGGQVPPGTWWTARWGTPPPPMEAEFGIFPSLWSDVNTGTDYPRWEVAAYDLPATVFSIAAHSVCIGFDWKQIPVKLFRAFSNPATAIGYESGDYRVRMLLGARTEHHWWRQTPDARLVEVQLLQTPHLDDAALVVYTAGPRP